MQQQMSIGRVWRTSFLSEIFLLQLAKEWCPDATPLPSLDWVALQFQPKTFQAARPSGTLVG